MSNSYIDESMVDAFVYEMTQIVEALEQLIITSEKSKSFSDEAINEIFRFMHTLKGSSAMMMFTEMSMLAHKLEDVFYVIRDNKQVSYDFTALVDIILESIDYFKIELMKIKSGEKPDGDNSLLVTKLLKYVDKMKSSIEVKDIKKPQSTIATTNIIEEKPKVKINKNKKLSYYKAVLWFKKDCEMENIRCYTVVYNISELVNEVFYKPKDIMENDNSVEEIRVKGFVIVIKTTELEDKIKEYLQETIFLEKLDFEEITEEIYEGFEKEAIVAESVEASKENSKDNKSVEKQDKKDISTNTKQSVISVNVDKLDKLMDMVGELVIAEAMVTQNPEVVGLEIDSFEKSSRQLHKITGELQDMVMAIRMVPLSTTFMKMHRVVRDMTRKLGKIIELDVFGEETEVDKNIIEKISDPLMHIIRNSVDHGIESEEERADKGKKAVGNIVLEAKNLGSDVLIIIKDDGRGLDKRKLYEKAMAQGLITREYEEMSDRELYNLILEPGFSTKEKVTEFSGRGVGMDVVSKNVESIGGTVLIESMLGKGTTTILKLPLTLGIIEGMNIKVGKSRFTLPIVTIKESFRASNSEIIKDTEGNEMIMVRGLCYPIIRLHKFYDISKATNDFEEGILIMVENDDKSWCIFADELLGQQQVVVKSLPEYIKKYRKIKGLGGCTLLGDGSISLILDVSEFNL